jgi:hypothetical protein
MAKKQFERLIINRVIDGVLVVALENHPGKRATQVRVITGDNVTPLDPICFKDERFCPGYIEHDRALADKLGEKAMALYNSGQLG